jgi:uncharacterized protein YutE (UPF0331/DUF86 family)
MIDSDLVAKKLALIETCVHQLRTLARPEVIDVASHIVSDERLGEPETNRDLFDLLVRARKLPEALASSLRDMAGFRNILVHGYQEVDLGIVEDVLKHHLDDLLAFVAAVRGGGSAPSE